MRGFAIASNQTPLAQLTALIQPNPVTATKEVIEGHPGAILTLSANREISGSGILWMTYAKNPHGHTATSDTRLGQLAAYDAENLTRHDRPWIELHAWELSLDSAVSFLTEFQSPSKFLVGARTIPVGLGASATEIRNEILRF